MRHLVTGIVGCLSPTIMVNAAAAPIAAVSSDARYFGEGRIGADQPFPVHIQIQRTRGSIASGVISTPDAAFKLLDLKGTDTLTGRFSGDGIDGPITLRFTGMDVEGSFEIAGQAGSLRAKRTNLDAATALKPPEQRLELTPAQWNQDLDRLVQILTTEHGLPFTHVSRTALLGEAAKIRAQIPSLTGVQIALHFRRLGAMIGDGHTSVDLPRGRPRYPLEIFWFEDGLRVIAAPVDQAGLLGAKLISIDGVAVAKLVDAMRRYIGQHETEWGFRNAAPYLLDRADLLDAVGVGEGTRRTFRFELPDRSSRDIMLDATIDRPATIPLGANLPIWLRNPDKSFWYERLPDGSIYVNWRSYDELAARSAALFSGLDRQHPPRLIVDLRDSGGGDFNKGRAFIDQIKARPWLNRKGRLFVLIGRQTFSAAMTNAVDFRKTTSATLIGEPPGAAPNNWQEVRFFHLPNSGFRVGVSTRHYAFLPGEMIVRPDISVAPTPSDWVAGPDQAVNRALSFPLMP